ncbi:T9SS type A sorting domain-containing protein [bacterium]|nr:T9SS type A sorting domain-containing protein [bacterium]
MRRTFRLTLLLTFVFVSYLALPSYAQTLPVEEVMRTTPWGGWYDIAYMDDYAYVGTSAGGIRVLDISSPHYPQDVGSWFWTEDIGRTRDLEVGDGYLYALGEDYSCDLAILDLSNPEQPVQTGYLDDLPGNTIAIHLVGDYLYAMVDGVPHPLTIIDVSDPMNPVVASVIEDMDRVRVSGVDGNYLYIRNSDHQLVVYDISDPLNPTQVGDSDHEEWGDCFVIHNGYVYIGDRGHRGVNIYDVTDPTNPTFVTRTTHFGAVEDITAQNGYLYESVYFFNEFYSALRFFSLDNPESPELIATLDQFEVLDAISVHDNVLYTQTWTLATSLAGLVAVDITDNYHPFVTSDISLAQSFEGLIVRPDRILIPTDSGLYYLKTINEPVPRIVDFYSYDEDVISVVSTDDHIFMKYEGYYQGAETFHTIDLSNPAQPVVTVDTTASGGEQMQVVGDHIIYNYYEVFSALDISDPNDPTLVEMNEEIQVSVIHAVGDLVYALHNDDVDRFKIIDISDIEDSHVITSIQIPGNFDLEDIAINGDYAYFIDNGPSGSNDDFSIHTVDISNPYQPVYIGNYPSPVPMIAYYATCINDILYVWKRGTRLLAWDVSNPTSLDYLGEFWAERPIEGIGTYQDMLLVSTGPALLYLEYIDGAFVEHRIENIGNGSDDGSMPATFEFPTPYPNPFNSATTVEVTLPEDASLKLTVYNVAGQEVMTLADANLSAGTHQFSLDASVLSAGQYFIQANVGGDIFKTQKVVFLP